MDMRTDDMRLFDLLGDLSDKNKQTLLVAEERVAVVAGQTLLAVMASGVVLTMLQ